MIRQMLSSGSATRERRPSNQAVSYVIGFALIFSLGVLSALGLFIFGFDLVSDVDENEIVTTGEENMKIIQAELTDLTSQQTASRETRIQMSNAQLGFGEISTIAIEASGETFDFTGAQRLEWDTRLLVYRLPDSGTAFVYAFGHLFQRFDDPNSQAVSKQSPPIDYTNNHISIILPTIENPPASSDQVSVGSMTEQTIQAMKPRPVSGSTTSIERTNSQSGGGAVNMTGNITIEGTKYPQAWKEAFEHIGLENVQIRQTGPEEYQVEGEFTAEQLVVEQADIEIQFSS